MKIRTAVKDVQSEMEPYEVAGMIRQIATSLEDELRDEKKENGKRWVTWAKFRRVQSMNNELRLENERLRRILDSHLKHGG